MKQSILNNNKPCPKFNNCPNNACNTKILTFNCNPIEKEYWKKQPKLPNNMDPTFYNVIYGCWLCNFNTQETENKYICNRSFFRTT